MAKKQNKKSKPAERYLSEQNLFQFDFEKIKEFSRSLEDDEKAIRYLNHVVQEYKSRGLMKTEHGKPRPHFTEKIEFLKEEIAKNGEYFLIKDREKLVWMKDPKDFAYLMNNLFALGFLSHAKNKWQIVCKHFSWANAEISVKQLTNLTNDVRNKEEFYNPSDQIKDIVHCLEKKI